MDKWSKGEGGKGRKGRRKGREGRKGGGRGGKGGRRGEKGGGRGEKEEEYVRGIGEYVAWTNGARVGMRKRWEGNG